MFKMIDADNSGQITFEELKAGLKRVGANLKESEIYDLMQAVRTKQISAWLFEIENSTNNLKEFILFFGSLQLGEDWHFFFLQTYLHPA